MSPLATGAAEGATGGGGGTLLLFALPLLLLGYLFWSQRNRQRKVKTMQAELGVGDEVMTSTGLYGRVVELDTQVVVLEAAPGVQLRWDRRAIVRSPLAEQPEVPEPGEGIDDGETPDQPREGQ